VAVKATFMNINTQAYVKVNPQSEVQKSSIIIFIMWHNKKKLSCWQKKLCLCFTVNRKLVSLAAQRCKECQTLCTPQYESSSFQITSPQDIIHML